MITIALDEGGHFEKLDQNEKCMYIGGIVFQCKDYLARNAELERLQFFFQEVCSEQGCQYPHDLHYNWENNQIVNFDAAKKVKDAIIAYLPDFLNGKGKWGTEKAPKGSYYFHALVGDKNGINYFENNLSNLVDDTVATNRYEHMAYRAIENLLFYNNRLKDENVILDLPTRVIRVNDDKDFEKEAIRTGHERHESYDSTFKATTLSSYRAALISMIKDSDRKDIHFADIRVESIYYEDNPQKNLKQGFLYLSDIICSLYGDILKNCGRADTGIKQLWFKSQQIVPDHCFVWSYNDFDQDYRSVYKAFEDKDYYNALSKIYKLSNKSENNFIVYDKLWFSPIKKRILFSSTIGDLENAVKKLDIDLTYSAVSVSEARFIYESLKPQTEELCSVDKNAQLLFHLSRAELMINNHEGNYLLAEKSFNHCLEYSQYVDVEEYLELRNMYSVSLCDSRSFDEAISLTKGTLDYEELLIDVKKAIYAKKDIIFIHYGRTLSQLGQCYAFKGDFVSAVDYFKRAITSFGNAEVEVRRTMSYLLHTAIEAKNLELYEEYSEKYFETRDRKEQLIRILSKENLANSYKLYVYLKAYYQLYLKKNDKKISKEILSLLEKCRKFENIKDHPWEMIFKYIAFISVAIGNKEYRTKGEEYIRLAKELNRPEGILKTILEEIDEQFRLVLEDNNPFEKSKLSYMYR